MIRAAAVVTLAATVLANPSISDACSKRHQSVFELFDEAKIVAYVDVQSIPPAAANGRLGAGPVGLTVKRTIKGAKKTTLLARENNTSCRVGFRAGKRALVFLDPRGRPLGHFEGYKEDHKRWETTLDAWAAATDDAARVGVLVAALENSDRLIAFDAGFHLIDQPALLAKLDADLRERIADAAASAPSHSMLPLLLVRLRNATAVGRLPTLQQAEAKALLAVTKFDAISDPKVLADAIDAGKGESDPERIAALDRCERVHGILLYRFTSYAGGVAEHFWATLAKACRTGTPQKF